MRLEGKKAFITAAAQGIGRAISETFIAEGADVVAVDLNSDLLSSLVGAKVLKVDVTDKKALSAAIQCMDCDVLVKSFRHSIWLQNLASIQPRTEP